MKNRLHHLIRRSHRFLGVSIGIQLLFWTISGLYFSWSDMDEVHGDYQKKPPRFFSKNLELASPSVAVAHLQKAASVDSIVGIQLADVLGRPVYQIAYTLAGPARHGGGMHPAKTIQLADALTGALRGPLTENEAIAVAQDRYHGDGQVSKVHYLSDADCRPGHHEYRGQPLPAYAVHFDKPIATTVYVSAELGTTQKFRNTPWRRFDFLWMFHVMGYDDRDNITNWVLRIFSILGLATVLSGFSLFLVSSRWFRRVSGNISTP